MIKLYVTAEDFDFQEDKFYKERAKVSLKDWLLWHYDRVAGWFFGWYDQNWRSKGWHCDGQYSWLDRLYDRYMHWSCKFSHLTWTWDWERV